MKRLALILLFFFAADLCYAQAWSGILNSSRAENWQRANVGVPGGIPTNYTKCGSTIAAYSGTGATITNALAACGDLGGHSNTYVLLGPGTFTISDGILIQGNGHVVLRGSGPNSTTLAFTGSGVGCASGGENICVLNSNAFFEGSTATQPGNSNAATWTSGFTQGGTSITVTNVGSNGIKNGQVIILDQANDTTVQSGYYVCDLVAVCATEGGSGGRTIGGVNYSQMQMVTVASGCATTCTGTGPFTLTLNQPIYAGNWGQGAGSGHTGVWWVNPSTMIGIENLTIDNTASGVNPTAGIAFYDIYGGWAKNIRSIKGNRNHIWEFIAGRIEVRDSYFFGTQNGASQSYGVEFFPGADSLVENNIFQQIATPVMTGTGSQGNVVGYNFSINNLYSAATSFMQGSYYLHDAGAAFNLWEGNDMNGTFADDIHGVGGLSTAFRNWITGRDYNGTSGLATNLTNPIILDSYNRAYNFIGNVLGTPGYHNQYEAFPPSTGIANCNTTIYQFGFSGGQCNAASGIANDTVVRSSVMRWGNYDTVNAAVRFDATESSPAAITYVNAQTTPATHTLPNSFYLLSTPPFWGTMPFPAVGPDVSSGTGPGGFAYINPAQHCYRNVMNGPNDGTGSVLSFDANSCYVALPPGAPSPIVCPNIGEVGNNATCVQPPLLAFGKQGTSTTSMAIPISVNNCATVNLPECTGNGSVTLSTAYATITGTNAANFSIGTGPTKPCSNSLIIASGDYCTLTVTFTPSQVAGTNEVATLTIAYGGSVPSSVVALTGTSATVTTLGSITSPMALTAGVNYQLTQNISCATTCFTVAAPSSSFTDLNLNGFTVTWCTGTSTNQEGGVITRGNNWYTTVHNGSILQGAGSCTGVISGGWGSGAIIGTGSNGMSGTNAFNLTLAWSASQGRGVADNYAGTIIPTVQGTVIHDVTYTDNDPGNCNAVGCRSQDQFYSFTVIQAAQRTAVPVDAFYNVTGTGGPQGSFSTDSSGAICSNNLINLGTSVANGTVANGYVCQDWGNAMIVANNLLLGTGSGGGIISGRGIQLANVSGQAIQQAMIQNNVGVVNILDNDAEYPCATVEYGATYGIQIKVFNSGTMNNNTIQNNNLVTRAGPCGAYGFSTTNDVTAPTTGSIGNVLRNNQWVCIGNAGFTWTSTVNCAGMRIDYSVKLSTPMFQDYSDYFQGDSSDLYVYLDGSDPWNCFQCTFNKPATAVTGWVWIDFSHGLGGASSNFGTGPFTFVDPVFQGGATESNTNLSSWATNNPTQSFSYFVQFTQKVFCAGATNGKYINGCTVTYTGPHSTHTCTTDFTGSCSVAVTENKYAATSGAYAVTSYNTYSLAVSNGGCTTNTQTGVNVTSTNTSTVTLAGCGGTILTGTLPTLFGFDQLQFGAGHENTGLTYGWQRSWDSPCVWGLIEVTAGTYNFAAQCAAFIQSAVNHGAGVQFTMGRTPASRITGTCQGGYSGSNTCAQLASDIDGVNAITPAFITALANYMSTTWPNVKWRIEGRNEADLANECAENSAIGGHCSMVHLVKEQETIFNTIKAINPAIQVLCPPASTFNHFGVHLYGGADTAIPPFPGSGFAAAEGLNYCDVMAVHPYFSLNGGSPDVGSGTTCGTTGSNFACQPEEAVNGSFGGCSGGALGQIPCILAANGKSGLPVESSETDWGSTPPNLIPSPGLTDTQKRQWIGRYIIYAWNAGQTNITWYTWECNSGNLAVCFGTLSGSGVSAAGAIALGTIQDWLIGSTYSASPCTIVSGTTYECALTVNTASGKTGPAHIVFDNSGATPTINAFGANTAYRLDGTSFALGTNYIVDGEPTLLINTSIVTPPQPNAPTVLFSGTVPLSGVFQGGVF